MSSIQPIEPILRANILLLADSFMELTGNPNLSALSRRVYNDSTFLGNLRAGKGGFGAAKYDQLIAAFMQIWPDGAPLPRLTDPTHIAGETHGQEPKQVRKESRSPRTTGGKTTEIIVKKKDQTKISASTERRSGGWFASQRQDWIAEMLVVYGFINARHVENKFNISTPQATKDLQKFCAENPDKIAYNASAHRYERKVGW
jgi:hypothetical protein